MTFKSEAEALDALEETRARLIEDGYHVAVELAEQHGAVHGQMVLSEMERRGLFLPGDEEKSQHWIANVFKGKKYKDTWEKLWHVKVGNKERNVHAAPRMLWKLKGAPDPDGSRRDTVCSVCGRGEKDRPAISKLRAALETMRKLHFPNRGKLSNEENEAMTALGRWLAKTVERGE